VLTDDERHELLRAAREAIAHEVAGGPRPSPPRLVDPMRRAGAFVSLHLHGSLKGCIGHPGGDRHLAAVVPECAVAAATGDPRFAPLRAEDLDRVHIEISVLGPIEPVVNPAEIVVGRHGLIVEKGYLKGLLLPQVAVEQQWDREAFIEHTCLKAGLRPDAWKTGAKLLRFEAEVFSEQGRPTSQA
jgi:uncharacterized protein